MIQEIAPHKFDNAFKAEKPDDNSYIWIFHENQVMLKDIEGKLEPVAYKKMKAIDAYVDEKLTYLFKIDDTKFFLLTDVNILNKSDWVMRDFSIFREMEDDCIAFAGVTAKHLYEWYASNKYCGSCGEKTSKDTVERALCCSKCNTKIYPRISPVVMVAITKGDKLLLTRYAKGKYKKYALVAGYVEVGETLEEAVKREVMEEVGLKVKNLRYYKNQPWSFSNSLLVGFFAELDGSDKITLDLNELSEATWVSREEIPINKTKISLSNTMIEAFKKGEI